MFVGMAAFRSFSVPSSVGDRSYFRVPESRSQYLDRLGAHHATHVLGTPSHWRRALMSPSACEIAPQYARLSREIADQTIWDSLHAFYPHARTGHAFASTEADVAFEVTDGLEGFPASIVDGSTGDVVLKMQGGSLRVRSPGRPRDMLAKMLLSLRTTKASWTREIWSSAVGIATTFLAEGEGH
jgi:hypothetical protein